MHFREIFLVATEASIVLMCAAMTLPFYPAYRNMMLQYADQGPSPLLKWSVFIHVVAVFGYAIFSADEAA